MTSIVESATETNRRNWDERVAVHLADRTGFYAVEKFRRGDDVLGPIEAGEIGDVRGRRLLHRLPQAYPRIPLSFSLKASKPAG